MKRGDLVQKFADEIEAHLKRNETDMFYIAHYVMRVAEENGMLPPWREDESPIGYGAAYLSDDDVYKNYYKFKHSWEEK